MNKNHNSRFTVLLLILCLITSLICGVSCNDSVDSDVDEVRTVCFSSGENSSRGLGTEQTLEHPIEELYWAYTAVKKSGSYTIGQSEKDPNPSASIAAITASGSGFDITTWGSGTGPTAPDLLAYNDGIDGVHAAGYMLKPVKAGAAPGLSGTVGPFSVGKWEFKIFGYEKYNEEENRFEGLIYTGVVKNADNTHTSEIDKKSTGNNQQIIFELGNKGATAMGIFTVGNMFITVPEGKQFFGDVGADAEVIVKVFDVTYSTSKPVLIAQSKTPITKSTKVTLNTKNQINADIANRKILEGNGSLQDYANENSTGDFDGVFKPGMSIVLNGFSLVEKPTGTGTYPANPDAPRTDLFYVADEKIDPNATSDIKAKVDAKTNWARLLPADHRFKIVAEYKDSYTVGDNIWETSPTERYSYTNANDDGSAAGSDTGTPLNVLFDKEYEQVGTIKEYVLPIISGVKTTIFGDINDLQWAEGETQNVDFGYGVAKIVWTVGTGDDEKTVTDYYDTLKAACEALNASPQVTKTGKAVSTTKPATEIILLTAVENDEVPSTTSTNTKVRYNNVKFLHNITIASDKTLTLELAKDAATDATEKREYVFKGGKIVNFSLGTGAGSGESYAASKDVWITTSATTATGTDYPEVTIDAATDSVRFSGAASSLVVTALDNTNNANKGLFLGTTADTGATITSVATLEITKGRLEIGSRACIGTLTSKGAASGDVVLKSAKDAVVQKYAFGATPTVLFDTVSSGAIGAVVKNAAVENAVDYGGFKEIQLINGGTTKYIYGIEGLPLTLPLYSKANASGDATDYECDFSVDEPYAFMHWNTTENTAVPSTTIPAGTSYADTAKFTPTAGSTATENKLYAVIAQPIGGRIFNVGTAPLANTDYAFYGVAKGTLNELTEWKNIPASIADDAGKAVYQVEKLTGAVYYITADDSTKPVSVVYTKTDPRDSVTADPWYYTTGTSPVKDKFTQPETIATTIAGETLNGYTGWANGTQTIYQSLLDSKVADYLFDRLNFWTSDAADTTTDPDKSLYTYWDWARQVFDKTELEYNTATPSEVVGPLYNFMVFRNI